MTDDSVRTAFRTGQRATTARLSLGKAAPGFHEYLLKQDDTPVAIVRGKEIVCGGEHFAVIPLLPADWEQRALYRHSLDNVPYWDGERRLRSLDVLLMNLSECKRIHEALDDAVDAEDDEFFAGIPVVAYTGQQPEDYPEPAPWVPDWEPEPETPEPTGRAAQPRDEYLASKQPAPPAKIYPWVFWYRGRGGASHRVIFEGAYEDAQRFWDNLSTAFEMTSRRP